MFATLEFDRLRKIPDELLQFIALQPELRFLVDGARNFGHQSSTVNLLKGLVDRTQFSGRIVLVYLDARFPDHGDTREKLAHLLTGLDPRHIETACVAYGTCRDIRFLPYARRAELKGRSAIGFTGGFDDMSINLAAELKTTFFFRLEPFLWDDDASRKEHPHYKTSRIERADGRFYYLADEISNFSNLSYKLLPTKGQSISEATWMWYGHEQTFDTGLRLRVRNAASIHQSLTRFPRLRLWSWYGLHHFKEQVAELTLNLIVVALGAQETTKGPIIAACLSTLPASAGMFDLIEALSRDLADESKELPALRVALAKLLREETQEGQQVDPVRFDALMLSFRKHIGPWIDGRARVIVIRSYDATRQEWFDASAAIELALRDRSDRDIVLVEVGNVPVEIYDYFFVQSSLPAVFEGQATASLMLAKGKPFLQIPRAGHIIESGYPTQLDSADFTSEAEQALTAARNLRLQRIAPYALSDSKALPAEYWKAVSETAAFIQQTGVSDSSASTYFRAMHHYFDQDSNDKFLNALAALPNVAKLEPKITTLPAHQDDPMPSCPYAPARIELPIFDPIFKADPHRLYDSLREAGNAIVPIRLPSGLEAWLTLSRDLARRLLTEPKLSKKMSPSPATERNEPHALFQHMLTLDPPAHTRLRSLIAPEFTPQRIERLRPKIGSIVDALLDAVEGESEIDLLGMFARPLSMRVICEILGVEKADEPLIENFLARLLSDDLEQTQQAPVIAEEFHRFLLRLAQQKRERPDDSIYAGLVATHDRQEMTGHELTAMGFLLLAAGQETTMNLIGNGMIVLLADRERWRALCTGTHDVTETVEELLRLCGSLEFATARVATSDFTVDRVTIRTGDMVFVGLAAANYDPASFQDAHQFCPGRADAANHLAFGHGIHYCLGAPLARLEAELAFAGLARRFPEMELGIPSAKLEWTPGLIMRGVTRLPVGLHPRGVRTDT